MTKSNANAIVVKVSDFGKLNVSAKKISGENILDDLYGLIGCDCVEHVYDTIAGKEYDIWCDEEGKLRNGWIPTRALEMDGQVYDCIAGSYVIMQDGNGNFDNEEVKVIADDIVKKFALARQAIAEIISSKK